jgi:trimethylamine corrinoid protein
MATEDTFSKIKEALLVYDEVAVRDEAKRLVADGADPVQALEVLSDTIREIGEQFGAGEIFLPELILSADAMNAGAEVFTAALPKGVVTSRGTIVFGTVKGDIHSIGKTIVGSLLSASGFEVIDIGIDATPAMFAEAAEKNGADIVAATACMSTTLPGQRDVIEYLEAMGVREKYKVMVGGASCTQDWADHIGADGFGRDAAQAARLATELASVTSFR